MTTLTDLKREFSGPTAPLAMVAPKYFGVNSHRANDMAKRAIFPVPVMRLGSQKSPWLVRLSDLAKHIDARYKAAQIDWTKAHEIDWPIKGGHKKKGPPK